MQTDVFLGLVTFAFVGVMTPGPNNLMLLASGANFGLRRTLPHMAGIAVGVPVMALVLGFGATELFVRWPVLHLALKALCTVLLFYLAWKIATAAAPAAGETGGRPLTFLQAAGFQWVNPKAWSLALTAVTLYAAGGGIAEVFAVAAAFVLVSLVSTTTWTILGGQLRRWLLHPARLRGFNLAMAAMLLASLYPLLVG